MSRDHMLGHVPHIQFGSSKAESKRPPLGLRPRLIAAALRLVEVEEAIQRYVAAGLAVPSEWTDEKRELQPRSPLTFWQRYATGTEADCQLQVFSAEPGEPARPAALGVSAEEKAALLGAACVKCGCVIAPYRAWSTCEDVGPFCGLCCP